MGITRREDPRARLYPCPWREHWKRGIDHPGEAAGGAGAAPWGLGRAGKVFLGHYPAGSPRSRDVRWDLPAVHGEVLFPPERGSQRAAEPVPHSSSSGRSGKLNWGQNPTKIEVKPLWVQGTGHKKCPWKVQVQLSGEKSQSENISSILSYWVFLLSSLIRSQHRPWNYFSIASGRTF